MTLPELIAALEAATGPSRQLDAEIARAVYAPDGRVKQSPFNGEWCVYHPTQDRTLDRVRVLQFTASIDAALTLVPEGWVWAVHGPDSGNLAYACLCDRDVIQPPEPWLETYPTQESHAATPAIALCIAALRARE
jgi:hypothetical protein